ncbi:MAG: methylmalonyl Co-A mutase-associated GTPase MeaB [Saprospiraceae bacterium]|nr:methylmalonyl Co-A mutase-associated GTPase MeaB [Saprospiraceae bacterium]
MDWNVDKWAERILLKDRSSLARAITLIESSKKQDRILAKELLAKLGLPQEQKLRLGITGPPGVGKSSLIEKLGMNFIEQNLSVAVLSIDPSSQLHGGSILGDKSRMLDLSRQVAAFIRPSPSGLHLGGTARSTQDTIQLFEAAGFDVIMIETVGIGQSEISIFHICDLALMLVQPGAGDDLQNIKKGVMEWADFFVISKADGTTKELAEKTYQDLVHSLPGNSENSILKKQIFKSSIEDKESIQTIAKAVWQHWESLKSTDQLQQKRNLQQADYFFYHWAENFKEHLLFDQNFVNQLNTCREQLKIGAISREEAMNLLIRFTFAV